MNRVFWPATGLALLAAPPAIADVAVQQASAPSVSDRVAATALADVVVTANRSAQMIDRVAASVTVLTHDTIQNAQDNTIPDLLARTPGVNFTRNGGIGSVAGMSIRGAEGHHTVVLIDGVKMNDPSTTQGGFNFGNLLIGDTARIEVLRGPQSTLWGSQAIGGVVNIITAAPTAPLQSNLSAEAGSRNTRYIRAGVGGTGELLDWRVAASRYKTDGFSAYAPGTEDDGYANTGLSGRLNLKLSNAASVDVRALWSDGTNDFDGYGSDSDERGRTKELITYAGINLDLLDGRLRNRVGYALTDTVRHNANPDRQVQPVTFEAKGRNTRWDYQGVFAFTDAVSATFGAEAERASMGTRSLPDAANTTPYSRANANQNSAYAQLQWGMPSGLNLTAGMRYDHHERYGAHTVGQVAAAWSLNDGRTVWRASWGQGFRSPGLYELYSEYGNQTLSPEQFNAWELSVQKVLPGKATAIATYFHRTADNEIRYNGCSYGTIDAMCVIDGATRWGYYANVQRTHAQGVEISGTYTPAPALAFSANYTWTDATSASGPTRGLRLSRRPEYMANLTADYRFDSSLKVGMTVRYAGKSFNNDANTVVLDDYALVDLRASYPVADHVELYGRIENLFDAQYQTALDYGTPDRGVFGGVRVQF